MRSARATQSLAVKAVTVAPAAAATLAQVMPTNSAAMMRSMHNGSTGVMRVYLCDLATKTGGQNHSYEVPSKATWEDPANYIGPITFEWAVADGTNTFTEWL